MGLITFTLILLLVPSYLVLCSTDELIDIAEAHLLTNCTDECPSGELCIKGQCKNITTCSCVDRCCSGDCCSDDDCDDHRFFFYLPTLNICHCDENGRSKCLKRALYDEFCEISRQCPPNTYCSDTNGMVKRCRCPPGTRYIPGEDRCRRPTPPSQSDDSVRALEIYKITMIFASCLLGMVLVAFLYCIVKKSFCGSRTHGSSGPPDIMTLFAESAAEGGSPFGVQPPFEKPPSYDESQNHMKEIFGMPPPSYPGPSQNINDSTVTRTERSNRVSLSRMDRTRQALGTNTVPQQLETVAVISTGILPVIPSASEETTGVENRGFQSE